MNVLRICRQHRFRTAAWMAILVAGTAGCNDLTSHNESPGFDSLTGELPLANEAVATGPANLTDTHGQAQAEVELHGYGSEDLGPVKVVPGTGAASPSGAPSAAPSRATASQPTTTSDPPSRVVRNQLAPKESTVLPAIKPDELYEPQVVLSRAHELTCLVAVGDVLPNLSLARLSGEEVTLDSLRGDQLTVVVFWNNRLAFAREQFSRLAVEVARPYRHLGVNVVAVNVGDPVEQIELHGVPQDEVTCVLDVAGTAIEQVATAKLPRTYLIDGEGRILWFDIEYSRTTRRQLRNAIFFHSREQDAAS